MKQLCSILLLRTICLERVIISAAGYERLYASYSLNHGSPRYWVFTLVTVPLSIMP